MEVVAFFTLLAFLPNAADAGRYQECPEDWTQVNVKCYKFVEGSLNRDAASNRCRIRYGATLAVIENKKENKVVQGMRGSVCVSDMDNTNGTTEISFNSDMLIGGILLAVVA